MDSQLRAPTSRLLSMPLEVLLHISSYLTTPEFGMLRRSCKHLEASFFNSFAKEFFTKRQFMLTEFSLQALVDISKSRFGPCLRYLIISAERPIWHARSTVSDIEKSNKYRDEAISHQLLTTTGQDLVLLTEAFENLPNLVTVGLRDYNSRGRFRDGPEAKWNTYGAPTVLRETGTNLQSVLDNNNHDDYASRVFVKVLMTLGKTSNSKFERLEVILRRSALPDPAFYIPRYLDPIVSPVLAKIKALYLDLSIANTPTKISSNGRIEHCHNVDLMHFLCKFQALEHLRLNFQGYNTTFDARELLQWLSTSPDSSKAPVDPSLLSNRGLLQATNVPRSPPHPIKFENLKQIDFGFLQVTPRPLIEVYKNYQSTLRSISLHKVSFDSRKASREKENLWVELFDMLSVSGLELSSISLGYLSQTENGTRRRVLFKGSPPKSEIQWSGSGLKQALKGFRDAVFIERPVPDDSDDDSDEDDEDDEVDGLDDDDVSEDDED